MAGTAQFEIYKDQAGQFRWRLRAAAMSEPIASSEAYTSEAACKNGIRSVRKNAPTAIVQDLTK
jgi:uncharacterized protein YegP (UPF0339 family)